MKKIIVSLYFALAGFSVIAQKDTVRYSLDNNINGSFAKYSDKSFMASSGVLGDNSLSYSSFKLSSSTNYSMSFKDTVTSSELLEKLNVGFGDFFFSDVYSKSMARSIRNDNSFGLGYGRKKEFGKASVAMSYAVLYQSTYYIDGSIRSLARNSLRAKGKYDGDKVAFSAEVYYQPSFYSMKDYIVYGSARLVFFPKNKVNFIVQDVLNYISTSEVRMLHSINFGVGFSIKN
jgi:hypothetical protein